MRYSVPSDMNYPDGLPITARRDEIVAALRSRHPRVLIISGETGCGKSTQIPKMCLEAGRAELGRIGITQPRRIAAVTIAARIAEELGEKLGRTVGYKIRFQDRTVPGAAIKVMTDGMLLAETQSDRLLREYGTIIIDEAHERSLNIDFLMGIVRRLLDVRPELKVVITSATLDTEKYSRAFGNAPVLKVSGRSFPVGVEYRAPGPSAGFDDDGEEPAAAAVKPGRSGRGRGTEAAGGTEADYVEAAVEAVGYIRREKDPGDILIFMPTEQDIIETCRVLEGRRFPAVTVLPLFSRLSSGEQRRVYVERGAKIVVATNVAETSLTIPGIRYVIDTGLARIARYQPGTRIKSLPISRVSRASAEQRKGRAGRVRDGLCIRLYSEVDYDSRDEFTAPEILRSDLAEVILRMNGLGLGDPLDFPFIDKPSGKAVRDGYETLFELGAIIRRREGRRRGGRPGPDAGAEAGTGGGQAWGLTPVGRIMTMMPLDPRLGRMLCRAAVEGVLPEVAVIASALSIRDPRERPPGQSARADEVQSSFVRPDSDFLSYLGLWHGFHGTAADGPATEMTAAAKRRFCQEHMLSFLRMREWTYLHQEIASVIREIDLVRRMERLAAGDRQGGSALGRTGEASPGKKGPGAPARPLDRPHRDVSPALFAAVHRSILSGYISNIAVRKDRNIYTAARGCEVTLWPGSALYGKSADWIVAAEIVKTSRLYGRRAARIDPAWLEELAGHLVKRSFHDPAWNKERGEVTAMERLTLFGLEIVKDRRVSYGRVAPEEAHAIFVMSGLVEGDIEDPPAFLRQNQALRLRLEAVQEKLRRKDLIAPDHKLGAFYSARIPGLRDMRSLSRLIADRGGDDGFLRMSEADILERPIEAGTLAGLPDEIEISGRRFRAEYKFSPGADDDGVTVRVPVPELPCIPAERGEWGVPGRLPEIVACLLKGLPKRYRRQFQPLADKVAEIVAALPARAEDMPLAAVVGGVVARRSGSAIPGSAWAEAEAALPRHLKLLVAAVDPATGRVVASSRDIELLRRKVGAVDGCPSKMDSPAWREAAGRWEKSDQAEWTFGDIPEAIPVGASLFAYPGLTVSTEGGFKLGLRLFPSRSEAEASHERAVRAWLEKKFACDLAFIGRYLKLPAECAAAAGPFGGREELEKKIEEKLRRVVLERNIRTAGDLGAHEADLNRLLFENGHIILESAIKVIALAADIQVGLEGREAGGLKKAVAPAGSRARSLGELGRTTRPAVAPAYIEEIRAAIGDLVPPDFIGAYGIDRLKELPRYLEALKSRLGRARIDPEKDRVKSERIAPYAEALDGLVSGLAGEERRRATALRKDPQAQAIPLEAAGRAAKRAAVEELRWMIEEFKVSMFAPEMKTAFPVSEVRLARKIREIEAMV